MTGVGIISQLYSNRETFFPFLCTTTIYNATQNTIYNTIHETTTHTFYSRHFYSTKGNHGGGSEEEINAALFAHFSPACGNMTFLMDDTPSKASTAAYTSDYAQTVFTSIHQIDLVPTIALLLGLPIPYANLGSLVPSLALLETAPQTATALALNAAQVWRYFTMYSSTANQLPGMEELEERLQQAVAVWKDALAHPDGEDSAVYLKACSLFKMFLSEALELGQRVWTRFDTRGMAMGSVILGIGIVVWCCPFFLDNDNTRSGVKTWRGPAPAQLWEILLTILFVIFSCGVLTFGNSYILEEEHVCMYMIGILGFVLTLRFVAAPTTTSGSQSTFVQRFAPLVIPVASRLGELFVSGHGQDPSVRAHNAHHPAFFLSSVLILAMARWHFFHGGITPSAQHMMVDCMSLICLGQSWWEKRHPDTERHGFGGTRCAIAMVLISLLLSIYQAIHAQKEATGKGKRTAGYAINVIIKLLLLIMIVTGPASATSMVLFSAQMTAIYIISGISGPTMVRFAYLKNPPMLVCLYILFKVAKSR